MEESIHLIEDKSKEVKGSWKKYFVKCAKGLLKKPKLSVFIKNGNTKLPFVTFSTLPIVTCPGAGDCASWCYSLKAWRYAGAYARQLQNTLLLKFRPEEIKNKFFEIPKDLKLRLYVDGDFDSLQTFKFWMNLLTNRPDIKAYGYSKSWDIINEFVKNGGKVPNNYVLNLSSGGKPQIVSAKQMEKLPFVRGWFTAIPIHYKGPKGFARYNDESYHKAVIKSSPKGSISCPGFCGECHMCGDLKYKNVSIMNGLH